MITLATSKVRTCRSVRSNSQARLVLVFLTLVCTLSVQADTLKPFASDGCSSFPNGTQQHQELWLSCCVAHDYAYWKGGTRTERLQADAALHSCVETVGEPKIADLMLAGVRAGGSPYLPTRFRWGYGWSYPRGYGALSAEELEQVEAASRNAGLSLWLRNRY